MLKASSLCLLVSVGVGVVINACSGSAMTFGPDGGVVPVGGIDGALDGEASPEGGPFVTPQPGGPLTISGAYAVTAVFLGETNRSGAPTKDAWKQYGENIDGLVTAKDSKNVCRRVAAADSAKQEDGNSGIDNSFGRTVLGFILGLVPTPSKTANDEIKSGGRTMMFNLLASPPRFGLLSAEAITSPPTFLPTEVRPAVASTVSGGPNSPLSISSSPTMTSDGVVYSGVASGIFHLELGLGNGVWRVPIHLARVIMTVPADGSAANAGTIAGVVPTEELVDEITKVAGRISPQLCGGSTLNTIQQTIRQASDILADGTQDPNRDCDAISIGIGFEAKKVTAAGIAAEPPTTPDPCN